MTAALGLLAAEGAASLTFSRLGEVANLSSSRLITYHFTDRAGLMKAVMERVLTDMSLSIGQQLSTFPPGSEQLRAFFEANANFLAEHRGHVVALVSTLTDDGGDEARSASEHSEAAVAALVVRAIKTGEVAEVDPAHVAFMMMRCVEGLAVAVAADPGLDPRPYASSMADFLLNGLIR